MHTFSVGLLVNGSADMQYAAASVAMEAVPVEEHSVCGVSVDDGEGL